MSPKFYPSVMCMKEPPPEEDIPFLERLGVDGFHVDIIDGIFAEGIIPTDILHRVRECTALPLGVHLMVRNPFDYLERLYTSHPETIYVHFESNNPIACLKDIRKHGCRAGLAVRPETRHRELTGILPYADMLLLLRVPPGTIGSQPEQCVDEKIDYLVQIPSRNFKVVCDGNVSSAFVQEWFPKGVEYFVCGMASRLFDENCDRTSVMKGLKSATFVNNLN